ncbi:MAG: ABC transporter ATP-binding protein [Planctomycetota bacterium]
MSADDDLLDRPVDLGFLPRLWPFVRPYRRAFGAGLLILLLSFGLEMLGPYLLRAAIDGPMRGTDLPAGERTAQLWWYAAGFLLVTALGAVFGYAYGQLTAWNGQRVIRDVRRRLFDHLLHAGAAFHERNAAGKLTTRVTSDVENLNELIATGVLQSAFDLLKIAGVLVALFFLDLKLALFTVATTPIVIVISVLFRRNAQRAYRAVRGKLALQNAYTAEVIGGVRATRAYGREPAVAARYAALNADTARSWRDTVFHFSVFFGLVDLSLRATSVGLLWFGGTAVLRGSAEPGVFVQFWLYFGMLTSPIRELGEKYNVLQAAFASTERIFAILGEPRFPPPQQAPVYRPRERRPMAVELRDVTFAYGDGPPVLRSVSLRADAGQTIAVVGPTGAGKTTLLSLVSRLRDVDGGSVLVDGEDVRRWDLTELRRRVAVVAQDLFLFTGTVLDNVRLFDRSIDEARVWRALELVGAADFVAALPDGLRARVEERGGTFSQGQRQLLAFARALVTDPCVLVLDEATASIDSATEARLQRALTAALRDRTALVVAHRLSTVQHSDRILVLQHGRVVEAGGHDELLRRGAIYAGMLRTCSGGPR